MSFKILRRKKEYISTVEEKYETSKANIVNVSIQNIILMKQDSHNSKQF